MPTRRARSSLERGLDVGEVDDQPWGRFLYFSDPDGNGWSMQQVDCTPAP